MIPLPFLISIVLRDLLHPLAMPLALAIGWFATRARMCVIGSVGLAAALILLSLRTPLPDGAERVSGVEPLHVIAPLLASFAMFGLRRWLRSRDAARPGSALTRAVRTALGGVLGACVGGAVFLGLGLLVITLGDVHDHEGGEGYLLVLIFVPAGLLLGAVCGGVIAWRRSTRRGARAVMPAP